jgi:hypothetical protein
MSKSKNSTSLYVLKSTYNNGFRSTKIVEKLGTVEELSKKLNGRDPIEWAKEHIAELNRLEKEEKREVMAKYSPVKQIAKNQQRVFNGGYLFLQKFYYELGLSDLCGTLQKEHHLSYNLDAIFSRLIYTRLLHLDDELSYYDNSCLFIEQPDFTPRQISRAMSVLAEEADTIRDYLYDSTRRLYGSGTDTLYYTTSIGLYESSHMEGFRGTVIPLEEYYDSNLIPIGYTINPAHEADPPLTENEKKIKEAFKDAPVISLGDAGLTSTASPTFRDWGNPNQFMTVIPLNKFNAEEKRIASDPSGWQCTSREGVFNLKELKRRDELNDPSRCYFKDIRTGSQRTIIIFSVYENDLMMKQRALVTNRSSLFAEPGPSRSNSNTAGISAIVTNILDESPIHLITLNNLRTDNLDRMRILAMEAAEMTDDMTEDERIRVHFITTFTAEIVYMSLLKRTSGFQKARSILHLLKNMNFMKIQSEGYIPLYTRSDLTDTMHDAVGFRTDYEIISNRQMNRLIRNKV